MVSTAVVSSPLLQIRRKGGGPAAPVAPGGPRVYLETHGCQMNVADSDLLVGILAAAGYQRVERPEDADVVVVNTCAVREKAETKVLARAHELGALKRKRPELVLSIVGCMAEHLKAGLADDAPVDVIAGPDSYRRMPDLLATARARAAGDAPVVDVRLDKGETYEGLSGAEGGDGVSGFVTIQRGCDKFCTFCVVPFTRGRERGSSPREVLRQVRELADEPKLCGYVHLPQQSGSDAVLERMRRGYTVADYLAIVARLRAAMPDIALTTDILSGFSGETEADHQATLELMRAVRFDSAFMLSLIHI